MLFGCFCGERKALEVFPDLDVRQEAAVSQTPEKQQLCSCFSCDPDTEPDHDAAAHLPLRYSLRINSAAHQTEAVKKAVFVAVCHVLFTADTGSC